VGFGEYGGRSLEELFGKSERGLGCNVGKRTNLKRDDGNGDTSTIPFSNFSFLPGRTLAEIMPTRASPTILYSFDASSPKPKNAKRMKEDTGIAHQNNNASLRDCELITIQM